MIGGHLSVPDGEAHREGEPPCEPAWKMARTGARLLPSRKRKLAGMLDLSKNFRE
jgi:hypothetical protein